MRLSNICKLLGVLCCFVVFSQVQAAPFIKVSGTSNRPNPPSKKINFTNKLVLKGSRGETLNFMVKIQSPKPGHLEFQGLQQSGSDAAPNLNPRFYTMEKIKLTKRSFVGANTGPHFDPLVPVSGDMAAKGADGKWFWGEISIPENAVPGTVKGSLTFAKLSIPFELTIWKMTMPKVPIYPMYANIEARDVELGHYKKERINPTPALWNKYVADLDATLMTKYLDMMREHHMYPVKSWIEAPGVQEDDNGQYVFDLVDYPRPDVSYYNVTIKKTPESIYFDLPAKMCTEKMFNDPNGISETMPHYMGIQNALRDLGYPKNNMTFLCDEPLQGWAADTGVNYIPTLIEYAKKVKEWAPNLKIMATMPATEEAAKYIDIIVPAPNFFGTWQDIGEVSISGYRDLQKQGTEIWWYLSCMSHGCSTQCKGCNVPYNNTSDMIIDRPATYIRSLGWLSAKYNIQAFFYYNAVEAYKNVLTKGDVWRRNYEFAGNGDGTLFYPGRPGEHGLTEHQPIASVRMKIWRETSNDYQYAKWMLDLSTKPKWWNNQFKRLTKSPTNWGKNYQKYQTLRNKVGDYLNKMNETFQ